MSQKKPNILLIYTGGTIGMMKDFKTGALKAFNFNNILKKIPELQLLDCEINTISLHDPIDSSNINPEYWVQIGDIIAKHYQGHDGFVVLHGTDTMSYTASALSFMLENIKKPVIFTGAQLPIGDLRTDAKENLITSIQIASLQENNQPVIQEVCLFFEFTLYRANRTSKVNAEHFQAFKSFNYPELVKSGVHLKVNYNYLLKPDSNTSFRFHKFLNTNIALIKLYPGITKEVISSVLKTPRLEAVILETFGAGNCSTDAWFINLLSETISKGVYVINVTQCLGGSVLMGLYETSNQLKDIGVISGKNITTEAALAKLMYMLSQDISQNQFKKLFETPICGELN